MVAVWAIASVYSAATLRADLVALTDRVAKLEATTKAPVTVVWKLDVSEAIAACDAQGVAGALQGPADRALSKVLADALPTVDSEVCR